MPAPAARGAVPAAADPAVVAQDIVIGRKRTTQNTNKLILFITILLEMFFLRLSQVRRIPL